MTTVASNSTTDVAIRRRTRVGPARPHNGELPVGGESVRVSAKWSKRSPPAIVATQRRTIIEAVPALVSRSLTSYGRHVDHRVGVATATKNLQDQLAQKEPRWSRVTRNGVGVAVLKGKANYLCKNRAQSVGAPRKLSFDDGSDIPRRRRTDAGRFFAGRMRPGPVTATNCPRGGAARVAGTTFGAPQECLQSTNCPKAELLRPKLGEGSRGGRSFRCSSSTHTSTRSAPFAPSGSIAAAGRMDFP